MLTQRQNQLLKVIIFQYIKTAQPVGSEWLAKKFGAKISPATIRNEMTKLMADGYLFQPHTSAGRVPTEKAFHYFIDNFLEKKELDQKTKKILTNIKSQKITEMIVKDISKKLAQLSGQLIILAFDENNFYYTGLSYLFAQPEFNQPGVIYNLSQVIDHLDKIMADIFDKIGEETEIFIGHQNPFSSFCSAILTRLPLPWQKNKAVFGLLGPMRMDYNKNISLIDYVKELLY